MDSSPSPENDPCFNRRLMLRNFNDENEDVDRRIDFIVLVQLNHIIHQPNHINTQKSKYQLNKKM